MAMYVTVKFGEGQEEIFNPNCRSVALLRNIQDRCQPMAEDDTEVQYADLDLSDESGNIKFLRDTPQRYANEILGDRESLILLRVDKHEGAYASYTPLLKDEEAITEDFLARLSVRDETDSDRPDSSRRAKSNTRRSPAAEKERDGRKSKAGDRNNRAGSKAEKNTARSRSRQGK